MRIYKICSQTLWGEALAAGVFKGAPIDLQDGYIHFSSAAQVRETASRHFAGQSDLLLLGIDPEVLGEALRWEPSRGGDLFPHLYGELPLSAVVTMEALPLGPDGHHRFPPLAGEIPVFDPAAAGWRKRGDRLFVGLVGPFWSKRDETGERYGFLAEERHLNRGGIVHGGMLMTFADQSLGMKAVSEVRDRAMATIQLDTHFVSAAREGDFVEAENRIVRRTKELVFLSGMLKVGDRVVSTSNGVWKLLGPLGRLSAGER